ncbi:MAG: peptide deformylase [Gammaproteobacteria bacterium]|nr:peptide deformylase [Gammaproteobacteria bacterium]
MTTYKIITYPDKRLKSIAKPVEKFDNDLRFFLSDLERTMRAGPGGVGIAAPQVGKNQRIVIVDVSSMAERSRKKKPLKHQGKMVLINPEITHWDGMVIGREGCMSVPDYTGNVIRAERITLDAYDEQGKQHSYTCEGFEARAVQHEIDHLDGLLFLDRLVSRHNDLFRRKIKPSK